MKKMIILLLLLVGCILLGAQQIESELIKPDTLYVGTPMQLLVSVTCAPGDSVLVPEPDVMDIFVPTDVQENEQLTDTAQLTQFLYTFQPFDVGTFTFPALPFTVQHQGTLTELKTKPFDVTIYSVLPDSAGAIRDIAPPVAVKLGWLDILLPFLLIALIIAAIIFIKRRRGRDTSVPKSPVPEDTRPAWRIALEMLYRLQDKKLLFNGEFLAFHFELSMILRFFLERQFHFNAMEMTTMEIKENLPMKDVQKRRDVLEKLRWFDMVKFARYAPTMADSEDAMAWVESFLKSYGSTPKTAEAKDA